MTGITQRVKVIALDPLVEMYCRLIDSYGIGNGRGTLLLPIGLVAHRSAAICHRSMKIARFVIKLLLLKVKIAHAGTRNC